MGWLQIIFGGIVSSATVVAIAIYVSQESFKKLLDRELEKFKYKLRVEAKKHEFTLKSQIEFKERQLSEFYGPIYAMLKRGRSKIYPYWVEGKLSEIDSQLRKLAIDANNKIVDIILAKSHLIDGAEIPESFINYLTHVAIWHSFLETEYRGVTIPINEMPEAYYSEEFDKEIFSTTVKLKRELYALYKEYEAISKF